MRNQVQNVIDNVTNELPEHPSIMTMGKLCLDLFKNYLNLVSGCMSVMGA